MKFGLEIEKFLFDLKNNRPSEGVFRFIDALSDYHKVTTGLNTVTNEFVLNLVEITTDPSDVPLEVLKQYIQNYLMLNSIAARESVSMVGMGSLPMKFQPHMLPKWAYFVQNSILDKRMQTSWVMNAESPLTRAGNCAGVHVHAQIDSQPEYLFSNRELQDKFNLGLMLTPMIAFSSSPYFFGEHEASSMRGHSYFHGVYKNFPSNGGLPPVMTSSEEVLKFFKSSAEHWIKSGTDLGLPAEDLKVLIQKKGASWNPIRWNRTWNTIEMRFFDSDRIDYDCSKFVWVCGAMKRTDIKGEALKCMMIESKENLNMKMIQESFKVQDGVVRILPTHGIEEMFFRAIKSGVKDSFVHAYLMRIQEFAKDQVDPEMKPLFAILEEVLMKKETTSEMILKNVGEQKSIDHTLTVSIVKQSITEEKEALRRLTQHFPGNSLHWLKLIK